MSSLDYYLIIDVGTTSVKAFAYSDNGDILDRISKSAPNIFREPGWVEQDPLKLWEMVQDVATEIINRFGKPNAVGLATQRATTIVWDKKTGEPLYNAITWQDTRSWEIAENLSKKFILRLGRFFGKIVSSIYKRSSSRKINYFITLANFRFGPNQPIIHLRWLLENVEDFKRAVRDHRALFGTIDSWIIWKMLGIHVTDYTNASATGLFDPFKLNWSNRLLKIVGIPKNILPKLIDNVKNLGKVDLLDEVDLTAVIADQQASLFSAGGFEKGSAKITNGTGTFVDLNVGETPYPSRLGTYPMVAIKLGTYIRYMLEGIVQTTGSAIDWLIDVGLLKDFEELSEMHGGDEKAIIFLPTFSGLGTPYWQSQIRGIIYGLSRDTDRIDIVRGLINGIAYRISEVIEILEEVSGIKISKIVADGNLSQNDNLLQKIADFSNKTILKPKNLEGTSRGAFLLTRAGYKNIKPEEIHKKPEIEKIFEPRANMVATKIKIKKFIESILNVKFFKKLP